MTVGDTHTAVVFLLSTGFFGALWVRNLHLERVVATWVMAEGRIVSAAIEDDGDGATPLLNYAYVVDDQQYFGTRIYPGGALLAAGFGAARRMLDLYAPGTPVWVLVNPADPSDAVLEPRLPMFVHVVTVLMMAGGLVFALLHTDLW